MGSGSETETENESTTVPADIAITQSADIEVPDYLPGFTSWDCAEILPVTMLCYALPVTVTNQKFIEINRSFLTSASGYVGATLASGYSGAEILKIT